jgi:hypothetical protein
MAESGIAAVRATDSNYNERRMKATLLNASLSTFLLFLFILGAAERQVQIGNKASALGNGSWQWTVFLGGTQESLSSVKCVRYSLNDPDFAEPVRKVCQAGRAGLAFATSGGATRSFSLKAVVEWDDGNTTELTYLVRRPAEN